MEQSVQNKFLKKDNAVIVFLSLVVSILTFYSISAGFYDLERGNQFASLVGKLLSIPYLVFVIPSYYLMSLGNPGDLEGLSLGIGILGTFLSPVIAFIFWFIIFWSLSKIAKRFINSDKNFLWKHLLSTIIVVFICSPYFYYKTGTNSADACLSGSLNSEMMSGTLTLMGTDKKVISGPETFTVGPDSCFDNIIKSMVYKENPSTKEVINYCLKLSDVKKVWGTDIPYQDYCIYQFGFNPAGSLIKDYPGLFSPTSNQFKQDTLSEEERENQNRAFFQTDLCKIFGSLTNSDDKRDKCLTYYINYTINPYKPMTEVYCSAFVGQDLPERCKLY
jgi:hypothetical protein